MAENGIRESIPRTGDQRFPTGAGDHTDDSDLPRQTCTAFGQSTHPHATFTQGTSTAAAAAGVLAIRTGVDAKEQAHVHIQLPPPRHP